MNKKREKLEVDSSWSINGEIFLGWVEENKAVFSPHEPNFFPEPTMKILIFLALVESGKTLSYDEIHQFLLSKGVISGNISRNTLRTSASNLKRSLNDCEHSLDVASSRGLFQILKRSEHSSKKLTAKPKSSQKPLVAETVKMNSVDHALLLMDKPAIKAEDIASIIVQKAVLPFKALFLLDWSARWWEIYFSQEAELRTPYEIEAWETLGIKQRLYKSMTIHKCLGFVGLAPAEGLTEIEMLKIILQDKHIEQVHYLAIDSSPRLLRDHMGLLKETLTLEIETGRLLCAGVLADIFSEMNEALDRARQRFLSLKKIQYINDFLPSTSGLFVTYLGNCLGDNFPDQETEIFSLVRNTFKNRPLEFLVGVSVMRDTPDQYKRTWDDFLIQTPKHLLDTKKVLISNRSENSNELSEFVLSPNSDDEKRYPVVHPESYTARYGIQGQIYRFYYRLSFDLTLAVNFNSNIEPLPAGTLILLFNIIKYDIKTLIRSIENGMSFMIQYKSDFHQIIEASNGKREYALFSAYLSEES